MKKLNLIIVATFVASLFLFNSCSKDKETEEPSSSILPGSFKVDIPSSLSNETGSGKMYKTASGDTIQGNEIYEHLNTFIWVGEESAQIVEDIMTAIAVYNINKPMSLSFKGDDDGRTKNLVVVENSSFDGVNWEYQLTMTDATSENNADGGNAIQIFWNRKPIKGIAILKPYNINRDENSTESDVMIRIDYSEAGEYGYTAHMIVSITGLPVANPLVDPYSMSTLKMFAGRTGDNVDVYGNSNHPNATFFTNDAGFNWAFVAASKEKDDIGVAEVGLPPSTLNSTVRDTLLGYYSVKDVFTREIYELWPTIDSTDVNAYLQNTDAPGYFDANGFVQGGTSPGSQYDDIVARTKNLTPYNPTDISNLTISFK